MFKIKLYYFFQNQDGNIKLYSLSGSNSADGQLEISKIFNFWKNNKGNKCSGRPNPEDRINKKTDDQKNDQTSI